MDSATIELFRKIVEYLPQGFILYDPSFRVLIFNRSAEKLFSLRPEEVIGRTFSLGDVPNTRFDTLNRVFFPSLASQMKMVSPQGTYPSVIDLSFTDPKLEIRVTTLKFVDTRGSATGFAKIVEDRTQETLIMQSKSEFVSLISHQLRTPLTAVNWTFQILLKENLAENQRDLVKTGALATAELVSRIDDAIEVTKIEDGRFDYKFAVLDLEVLLRDVIEKEKMIAGQYDVAVVFEGLKNQAAQITADTHKLSVAISNLVDNAIRYSKNGGTVRISLAKVPDHPFFRMTVVDSGIGIPKEDMGRIFTKFFRSENARRVQPDGNGLGLFITKNIIETHGGKITVQSSLDQGSAFSVFLPSDPKLIPALQSQQ